MEIYADNFWRTLPDILHGIAACDYAAVDLEMSGGVYASHSSPLKNMYRSEEDRVYASARRGATMHNTMELGLALAKFKDGEYTLEP